MAEYTVATADEIPEGDAIGVSVDGLEIAVFKIDGEFYAIQNRCIHRRLTLHNFNEERLHEDECLTDGPGSLNSEECVVSCPGHGWKFDLRTGENPVNGKRMRTFDVEAVDGEVRVTV